MPQSKLNRPQSTFRRALALVTLATMTAPYLPLLAQDPGMQEPSMAAPAIPKQPVAQGKVGGDVRLAREVGRNGGGQQRFQPGQRRARVRQMQMSLTNQVWAAQGWTSERGAALGGRDGAGEAGRGAAWQDGVGALDHRTVRRER